MIELVKKAREYAVRVHNAAGCTYGDDEELYEVHLDEVYRWTGKFPDIFYVEEDYINVSAAAYTHDVDEDAQQTYNDYMGVTNKDVADITLAVTDVPAETRMLRFLLTVPKIIRDYRALVLKVCDIGANSNYGKGQKNSMYRKYQNEWAYKRYIFITASRQYSKFINLEEFDKLIGAVDGTLFYSHVK